MIDINKEHLLPLSQAANNQLCSLLHAAASKSTDIISRRLMMIDVDPVRKRHESATEAEHDAAIQRLVEVTSYLEQFGWQALATVDTATADAPTIGLTCLPMMPVLPKQR